MDRQNRLEGNRITFSFLPNHVSFGGEDPIDLLALALSMVAAATATRGMDLSEIARTATEARARIRLPFEGENFGAKRGRERSMRRERARRATRRGIREQAWSCLEGWDRCAIRQNAI